MTLHHTYAPVVVETDMVEGYGLQFRDGQHLIASYNSIIDGPYVDDSYIELARTFENRRSNTQAGPGATFNSKYHDADQDFTVQIQIKTPKNFQYNLSEYIAASSLVTYPGSATAIKPGGSRYDLQDGGTTPVGFADKTGANQNLQYLDPFMETLWSIEGTIVPDYGVDTHNIADASRIPLARGMLQAIESGANAGKAKVVFEFFGAADDGAGVARPRYYKLESTVFLDPDTQYTLTFRKVTNYGLTDATGGTTSTLWINPVGTNIEIYIDEATIPDSLSLVDSTPCAHGQNYDVIIGSSYVNNILDKGGNYNADGSGFGLSHNGAITDHQHFMTQYNDQPGFFIMGFFRLWTTAVPQKQFAQWTRSSIADSAHQSSLLYNLEIDGSKGRTVKSKSRYSVLFKKGFKSFGTSSPRSLNNVFAYTQGTWAMEDCLGYAGLPSSFKEWVSPICTALAPFKTDESDKYGILAFENSSVFEDLDSVGNFKQGYLTSYGLLAEYGAGDDWQAGMVDDRTFFFGRGGFPKVFNGREFSTLGLRPWMAGQLHLQTVNTGGSLGDATNDIYIGFRVVYVSEEYDLLSISPQMVAQLPTGAATKSINMWHISPHPDPRVSNIYIYRTTQQLSHTEALIAPVYLTPETPLQNRATATVVFSQADTDLIGAVLDLSITDVPDAEYGAILNGQLYVNDKQEPSALYRSYPGNPEQFDRIATEIKLDEGAGDRINGMLSAFGAVFVFKSSSVWRIDPLDTVNVQQTKINDLGLISPLGLLLITPGDTGGQAIFTWTKQGPYLFNGVNWQYIGFATEGSLDNPYAFLDPSTISVVHSPKDRELLCFYKSIDTAGGGKINPRYDGCLVYNYRFNIWYSYEGVPGFKGLTTVINAATQRDLVLIGDERGEILQWSNSDYDYFPTKVTGLVVSYTGSSGLLVLDSALANVRVSSLWITIIRYTGASVSQFFSWPMIKADSLTDVYLDLERNSGNLPFTPVAGDTFIVGLAPARLTFPWDVMDVPWVDKQINGLYSWHNAEFHFRTAKDWNETFSVWEILSDSTGKRKYSVFAPAKFCEALKMDLVSFDVDARLDAYAYQVHYKDEGVTKQ